jgi:hypothetical protein
VSDEWQLPMHIEDLNDAILAAVDALGGPKVVGVMLWADLEPAPAGNRLRDCLNSARRERLTPGQLALIRRKAREVGCHVLASYEMKVAGYARPVPIAPEDEQAEAMRKFVRAVEDLKAMSAKLGAVA